MTHPPTSSATQPPAPAADTPPTWTEEDQAAADTNCQATYGPDSHAVNTPAIGDPKRAGVTYPCTQPTPPKPAPTPR